ncbi:MAG: ribonuclease HII [Saprospiraceae bacterium]|nr:ribonuclease HII [Saprospiraceae bacterium]
MALRVNYSKNLLEAGCDEAGRGCLAGPVFAAAVILPARWHHPLLNDSKHLSESDRNTLRPIIERKALAWSVAMCTPEEIDKINILQASILAMHRAVASLSLLPQHLLIDGNRFKPYLGIPHTCIVGGDGKFTSIAAASILAKTHRDAWMTEAQDAFPQYHWLENKGYPTLVHREAVLLLGPSPHHRLSFKIDGIPIGERFP